MTNESDSGPWIILLSGTSCSGKTTLSGTLRHRLSSPQRPFLHIEADRFVPHIPDEVGDGSLTVSLHRAISRAIASFAEQGFDLIVDGVLPYGHSDSIVDALDIYRRHRLCYVGVHCEVEVLEQRERERGNRREGWARQQYQDIHVGQVYDIEVDTTTNRVDGNADRIIRYLARRDPQLTVTIKELGD